MDNATEDNPAREDADGEEDQSRAATAGDLFDLATWLEKRLNGLQGGSEAVTEQILGDLGGIRTECHRLSDQMDAQAVQLRRLEGLAGPKLHIWAFERTNGVRFMRLNSAST